MSRFRLHRGFTIVEVLITLVIVTALLTLGVVGVRNLQAYSRDDERRADIAAISRGLEQRYNRGNPIATSPDVSQGYYPGNNEVLHIDGASRSGFVPAQYPNTYRTLAFPGTQAANFMNPGGNYAWTLACTWSCPAADDTTMISNALVNDKYVYIPIDVSNNVCCCSGCTHYALYWRSEVDNSIQIVRSKHQ
ncbi:type II secretion system protein [Candidatus Saccharibacteria bacterium]|nr:type II secretion system protein [Candidatus Saccharibacteria bacterium]